LARGDPETGIYVVQAAAYAAPELLRRMVPSLTVAGGWTYGRLILEARYAHGLQSVFEDADGLVEGFVRAGAHEPTIRRLVPLFGPSLEAARPRALTFLAGFRF
jgi:hypothetical protein